MRRQSRFVYQTQTDKVATRIHENVVRVAWLIAEAGREATVKILSGERHGKIYTKPGTQVEYRASAPWEAPAVMFGDLRRSMKSEVEVGARLVRSMWGSDLDKAPRLEKGGENLEPRPFIEPSEQAAMPKIREILSQKWF